MQIKLTQQGPSSFVSINRNYELTEYKLSRLHRTKQDKSIIPTVQSRIVLTVTYTKHRQSAGKYLLIIFRCTNKMYGVRSS